MRAAALDPVIHAPNRLQICCMLAGVDTIDFATLRKALKGHLAALKAMIATVPEA